MNEIFRGIVMHYFDFSIYFYFCVNSIYLVLLVCAVFSIHRQLKSRAWIENLRQRAVVFAPGISILAPAYNEEATITESVKSLLMLDYPNYEIIVINDGSKDQTLARMIPAFLLEPVTLFYDDRLSKTKVRGTYRSKLHPNLTVIDKENGGKADALNVGIGVAQLGIFCAVDSDSLIESDALLKVVMPFIEDPITTIASGGTVRIANGSTVRHGRVTDARLPHEFLPLMQVVEYTRAFLCGRIGWNVFNSTLVVSGAFGLFSRAAIQQIGGYLHGSVGEDMELVVRIHRHYRDENKPYRVVFVPDPVCWTEAPNNLKVLGRQRNRWQRGLAETLAKNRDMFLNPRYGILGLFAIPYFYIVELFGPVIEILSYISLVLGWSFGFLDQNALVLFFVSGVLYGVLMNIAAVLVGETYFSKYPKLHQFAALLGISVLESFGYRQMNFWWRLNGLYDYARGKTSWGTMSRTGFAATPPTPVVKLPNAKPVDVNQNVA